MMLCGGKESLKHVDIKFDLHAGEKEAEALKEYSFATRPADAAALVSWTDRKYAKNECTILDKVPPGTHIVGLVSQKKDHISSVAHVVVW
jgi:hypothetical protein